MKVICCILALLCLINKKTFSTSINVGTVLFTPLDTNKNCWSDYELSLLAARKIMQDSLPEPSSIDFTNPKIIPILLEYFQTCYDTIGKSTCGTTRDIMYLAFSDALGGYLRACILPILKRAYYAGQVTYADARRMFQLYDDIKCYLKTTGAGWSKSQGSFGVRFHVKPLKITKTGNELACSRLYFIVKTLPNSGFPETCGLKGQLKKKFQEGISKLHESSKKVEGFTENRKESSGIIDPASLFKAKHSKVNEEPGSLFKIKHSGVVEQPGSFLRLKHFDTEGNFLNKFSGLSGKELEKEAAHVQKMHKKDNMLSENRMVKTKESDVKGARMEVRSKRQKCGEEKCPKECPDPCARTIIIPLPMLDDPEKPNAIALPFKKHPLRSLYARSSAFVVQRLYVTVVKCICSKSTNPKDLLKFNAQFYKWIVSEVFPRLGDEQWYPAFGGILRIVETIKLSGYDNSGNSEASIKDPGYLYEKGVELEDSEQCKSEGEFDEEDTDKNKRLYIMGVATISLIWIAAIIFCCLWCATCRRRNKDNTCHCPCPGPGPGPLKFILIIRFFRNMLIPSKKDDFSRPEEKRRDSTESKHDHDHDRNHDNEHEREVQAHSYDSQETREPKESRPRSRSHSSTSMKSAQKRAKLDSKGGAGDQLVLKETPKHQFNVTLTPVWTYKSRPDEKGEGPDKVKIQDQIQMLWKKPSSEIQKDGSVTEGVTSDINELETTIKCTTKASTTVEVEESTESSSEVEGQKVYYVEKSPHAFDYTRACPYSLKKSTGNSSTNTNTQPKSDFSSTAVDLFDHIVACHNTYTNASANLYTQESDSESESERGPTSSSESANSTTTTEKKSNSRQK